MVLVGLLIFFVYISANRRYPELATQLQREEQLPPNEYLLNEWPLPQTEIPGLYGLRCRISNLRADEVKLSRSLTGTYFGDCLYLDASQKLQTIKVPLAFTRTRDNNYYHYIYGYSMPPSVAKLGELYLESRLKDQGLADNKEILLIIGSTPSAGEGIPSIDFLKPELALSQKQLTKFVGSGQSKHLGSKPIIPIVVLKPN